MFSQPRPILVTCSLHGNSGPRQGPDPLPHPPPRDSSEPNNTRRRESLWGGREGPGQVVFSLWEAAPGNPQSGMRCHYCSRTMQGPAGSQRQALSPGGSDSTAAICWATVTGCAGQSRRWPGVGGHPASRGGSGSLRRTAGLKVSGPGTT